MRRLASLLRSTFLWVILLPYMFTFVGAASNQLVLITNHDTFPVLARDSISGKILPDEEGHVLMTSATHLNALADILDFHDGWYSVGDLMLMLGQWGETFCPFIYMALVSIKLAENSGKKP